MKIYNGIILTLFLLLGTNSIAQHTSKNRLTITIIDVVDRTHLSDLTLIIASKDDTLNLKIDTVSPLVFNLDSSGIYTTTVIKDGYETLVHEWKNPSDSAELIIEFFMPKTTLTRREKRSAHYHSKHLEKKKCDNCGGFKRISPSFNEMWVIRSITYEQDSSSESFEFRKLR